MMQTPGAPEPRRDQYGLLYYWDNATRSWTRYPQGGNDPDWSHATGGDNELFNTDQNPLGTWEKTKNPSQEFATSKTAEYDPGYDDEPLDDDLYNEDEPQDDDIVIVPDGTIYAEGKVIGTVNEGWDEGYKMIYDWQTRNQYYPTVWIISDHGNAQVDNDYSQWVRKYEEETAKEQAYEQSDKDAPGEAIYNQRFPSGRLRVGDLVYHMSQAAYVGRIVDGPRWSADEGSLTSPTYREYLVAWEPPFRKYQEQPMEWTPEAYLQPAPNQDRSDTPEQMEQMVTQAKTAEWDEPSRNDPNRRRDPFGHEKTFNWESDVAITDTGHGYTITWMGEPMAQVADFDQAVKMVIDAMIESGEFLHVWRIGLEGDVEDLTHEIDQYLPQPQAEVADPFRLHRRDAPEQVDQMIMHANFFGGRTANTPVPGPLLQQIINDGVRDFQGINGDEPQMGTDWAAWHAATLAFRSLFDPEAEGFSTIDDPEGNAERIQDYKPHYDLQAVIQENPWLQEYTNPTLDTGEDDPQLRALTQIWHIVYNHLQDMNAPEVSGANWPDTMPPNPNVQGPDEPEDMIRGAKTAEYTNTIQTPEPLDQDDMVPEHPTGCPCEQCEFRREMDKQQQVHPRTAPFYDKVPRPNMMNQDSYKPTMISKTQPLIHEPNGNDMSDLKQPHDWNHVFDKFAWEDSQPDLASCPECRLPMTSRSSESFCGSCGHRQPHIYANEKNAQGPLLIPEAMAAGEALGIGGGETAGAAAGGGGLGGMMDAAMGKGKSFLQFHGLNSLLGGGDSGGAPSGGGGESPVAYPAGTVGHTAASDGEGNLGLAVNIDGQDVNPNIHSTDGLTNRAGDDPSDMKKGQLSSGAEGIVGELGQFFDKLLKHVQKFAEDPEMDGSADKSVRALDALIESLNPGYRDMGDMVVIEADPGEQGDSAIGVESDSDEGPGGNEPSEPHNKESAIANLEMEMQDAMAQFAAGNMDEATFMQIMNKAKQQQQGSGNQMGMLPEGNSGYEMATPSNGLGQALTHVANLPMGQGQMGQIGPPHPLGPAMQAPGSDKCEICGGPHPSAMHDTASNGVTTEPLIAKISRRPKLCPYHSDVIDYSLQFGDPREALSVISPQMYGSQWCKSGEFHATCNFKPAMVKQEYWDNREQELLQQRLDREQELLQQPEAPFAEVEEIEDTSFDSGEDTGYTPAEVTDISAVGAPMEMAASARYSYEWTDAFGNPLIVDQTYKMKSPQYDAADDVTIKKIGPGDKLDVLIHSDLGIDYEEQFTHEKLDTNAFQFEPEPVPVQEQEFSPETNNESPYYDDPGAVSDLSDLPTPVSHTEGGEPDQSGLHYLMDDSQAYDAATLARVAGKDFTYNEQNAFINESGRARNIEDMDLSGSHYGPLDNYLHDISEEFSLGW